MLLQTSLSTEERTYRFLSAMVAFFFCFSSRESCLAFSALLRNTGRSRRNAFHLGMTATLPAKSLSSSITGVANKAKQRHYSSSSSPSPSSSFSSLASSNLILDPLIICGPSGVGKGTLIEHWRKLEGGASDGFGFSVSHTTRAPRTGEVNGVHYHYVQVEEMKSLINAGSFLEYAQVHGNFYGTSYGALMDLKAMGKKCLLDIDVQGVKRIKSLEEEQQQQRPKKEVDSSSSLELILRPRYIFIAPPDRETLLNRLKGRGSESVESLQKRQANAQAELEYGLASLQRDDDVGITRSKHFDAVVVNDDLHEAVLDFDRIVKAMYDFDP